MRIHTRHIRMHSNDLAVILSLFEIREVRHRLGIGNDTGVHTWLKDSTINFSLCSRHEALAVDY